MLRNLLEHQRKLETVDKIIKKCADHQRRADRQNINKKYNVTSSSFLKSNNSFRRSANSTLDESVLKILNDDL